jgi:small conductance mechanosensitive channel
MLYAVCRAIDDHDPTGIAGVVVERLIEAVAVFVAIYVIGRVVRRVSDSALRRTGADRQVHALIHNVITVVTYSAALLSALSVALVNVGVVLTAAGVGTIALGLAFQDVLRNILAGIWLLLERPFRLGDNITVADQTGIVQNITLRTTTLRTGDGQLAILPNLTAFSNPVVNASTYDLRQFTVSMRVPDSADLEAAIKGSRAVLTDTADIAASPPPAVQPQLDGEFRVLHCKYWLDQNAHDPDKVAAGIAERLWRVIPSA